MIVYKLDLSSLESVRACATILLENEEKIDILINNAGKTKYIHIRARIGKGGLTVSNGGMTIID